MSGGSIYLVQKIPAYYLLLWFYQHTMQKSEWKYSNFITLPAYGYILLFSLKFASHHLSVVICSMLIGLFEVYVPGIYRSSIVNVYLEPVGWSLFKKHFLVFVTATTFTSRARHLLLKQRKSLQAPESWISCSALIKFAARPSSLLSLLSRDRLASPCFARQAQGGI